MGVAVGAGVEAGGGAAADHVEIEGDLVGLEEAEAVEGVCGGAGVVGFAPVVEPAAPVFGVHAEGVGADAVVDSEAVGGVGGEVDGGGDVGEGAEGEHEVGRAVGGEEGDGDAGAAEDSFEGGEVAAGVGEEGAVAVGGDDGFELGGRGGGEGFFESVAVGWGDVIGGVGAEFVFELDEDDGAADGGKVGLEVGVEGGEVAFGAAEEGGVVGTEAGGFRPEPVGEAAAIPFGADVGAGAEDNVEAAFGAEGAEVGDVVASGEVEMAFGGFVEVPEGVDGNAVEAEGEALIEDEGPAVDGDAGGVDLAAFENGGLSVEEQMGVLELNGRHDVSLDQSFGFRGDGVGEEGFEGDELEACFVGGAEDDGAGVAGFVGFVPASGADAPAVAGAEAGEIEFGAGGDEVVAAGA